jgi:hypothetical protein
VFPSKTDPGGSLVRKASPQDINNKNIPEINTAGYFFIFSSVNIFKL